ncbi:addiction module protein [Marinobacter bryozoorum]|nr:addiction module protein [Marinobacter bryozoorum]
MPGKTRIDDMRIQEVIDEASALPVDERAHVIESLLQSLNPTEVDIDEKWAEVAQARLAELESGESEAIPGEDVFNKVRSRLKK